MSRTRRVQGSGSIFYRASKQRWVAQISISDPATGKRRNITRLAKTAKEAQALLEELRQHHHTPTSAQTVHEWIDWYVAVHTAQQLQTESIRPSTAQAITVRTNRLKQVIPKALLISELDAHNLDQIKQRYDQTGYARATQNRDLTQLSTIMDLAVYHGLKNVNKSQGHAQTPDTKNR